ncbi:hypothetical protein MUK42_23079 [Musa troglodytarum]|uniref:Uncharacterized protein n=1 Tax=Musa troglodytarum TaxID=320322 RepID=A0A9E7G948_9LILI|nr:hypothetical protein MUK42_23079 [Musa troglodytarum]
MIPLKKLCVTTSATGASRIADGVEEEKEEEEEEEEEEHSPAGAAYCSKGRESSRSFGRPRR